jgi:glycoprotein-N-acetylgalactosamine 3-beta-galactosyltransferase
MVNEMDELNQKRFFPIGLDGYFQDDIVEDWYKDYLWYNTSMGSLSCCSDTFAAMHYVSVQEMHTLEYFVYHVHPFGMDKNSTETLPRKLSIDEIIAASDKKGFGREYTDHKPIHNFDSDERYKRR